jgi:hypothetical protein
MVLLFLRVVSLSVASRVVFISNTQLLLSPATSQLGIVGTAVGIVAFVASVVKYLVRPWLSLGVGIVPSNTGSQSGGFALRLRNRSAGIAKGISVSIAINGEPRYVVQGAEIDGRDDRLLLFVSRPMLPPTPDLSEFVFTYVAPPALDARPKPLVVFPLEWEHDYEIRAVFKSSSSLIAREANFKLELGILNTDLPRVTAIHWRKLRHFSFR